jgi:undecaprenyl-diphosphatase
MRVTRLQAAAGAVVIAASGVFAEVAEDALTGDPLAQLDLQAVQWFQAHRAPFITGFMQLWSNLNGMLPMAVWSVFFGAVLLRRRRDDWAIALAVAIPGIMLLNTAVKYLFHRPRPAFPDALSQLTTYSFPSGHVAVSTVFYGMLAAYIVSNARSWPARVATVAAALFLIFLVALSRVYLGAHYPSDIIAAFLEGIAWLALCLPIVGRVGRHVPRT